MARLPEILLELAEENEKLREENARLRRENAAFWAASVLPMIHADGSPNGKYFLRLPNSAVSPEPLRDFKVFWYPTREAAETALREALAKVAEELEAKA